MAITSSHRLRRESGRQVRALGMGSSDLVLNGLVIEGEAINVAAQQEIVNELAAQDDGGQVGHEIHRPVPEFPQPAVLVPAIAVNREPGVFVNVETAARRHMMLAAGQSAFDYPDPMKLIAQIV